jgi:hypothetical protein
MTFPGHTNPSYSLKCTHTLKTAITQNKTLSETLDTNVKSVVTRNLWLVKDCCVGNEAPSKIPAPEGEIIIGNVRAYYFTQRFVIYIILLKLSGQ